MIFISHPFNLLPTWHNPIIAIIFHYLQRASLKCGRFLVSHHGQSLGQCFGIADEVDSAANALNSHCIQNLVVFLSCFNLSLVSHAKMPNRESATVTPWIH